MIKDQLPIAVAGHERWALLMGAVAPAAVPSARRTDCGGAGETKEPSRSLSSATHISIPAGRRDARYWYTSFHNAITRLGDTGNLSPKHDPFPQLWCHL